MEQYIIFSSTLTDIADAIREKRGNGIEEWLPSEMPEAIRGIEGTGAADLTAWMMGIQESVIDEEGKAEYIPESAFSAQGRLSGIRYVDFPACREIGPGAFSACPALETALFPVCETIGDYAFCQCFALTDVSFPKCVMIGSYAFEDCRPSLYEVSFPACETIGDWAFFYCSSLFSVWLMGSRMVSIGDDVFRYTPITSPVYISEASSTFWGSIFVPGSLYAEYIADPVWSSYAERIVGV